MKTYILLVLAFCAVSAQMLGNCGMAPKYRPISCYEGKVLPEDIPELKKLLELFKDGGDDNVFALYLGDMFDKKEFREGRDPNETQQAELLGKCGVHPKYLPYECYEPRVLRRDREELRDAFDKLHESDLTSFNKVLTGLVDKKFQYYLPEEE